MIHGMISLLLICISPIPSDAKHVELVFAICIFKKKYTILFSTLYMCLSMCKYGHVSASAHRGQKRAPDPRDL